MDNKDLAVAIGSMSKQVARAEMRVFWKDNIRNDVDLGYESIPCQAWGAGLVYQAIPLEGGFMRHIPLAECHEIQIHPYDIDAIPKLEFDTTDND